MYYSSGCRFSASCTQLINNEIPDDRITDMQDSDYSTALVHADYPLYSTADETANASTNIYSGKVTDRSFEIKDVKTGKADNSAESLGTSGMFYTVYTVFVTEAVKGTNPSEVKTAKWVD